MLEEKTNLHNVSGRETKEESDKYKRILSIVIKVLDVESRSGVQELSIKVKDNQVQLNLKGL